MLCFTLVNTRTDKAKPQEVKYAGSGKVMKVV